MPIPFRRPSNPKPGRPPAGPSRPRLGATQPPPRLLWIAGGAVLGLVLLVVLGRALVHRPHPVAVAMTTVFVTTAYVPADTPITPGVARQTQVPAAKAPANAVTSPAQFAGMVTKAALAPETTITADQLMSTTQPSEVATGLADGTEAVTVLVPAIEAGGVKPGDTVNVLATFAQAQAFGARGVRQSPVTVWAATDARVLGVAPVDVPSGQASAAGRSSSAGGTQQVKMLSVILAVDASEAPTLMLGYHTGRIAMAVLPGSGSDAGAGTGISLSTLAQRLIPAPPQPPQPPSEAHAAPAPRPVYIPPVPSVPSIPREALPPATPAVPPAPKLHPIEVILGSNVRLEMVPKDGNAPSEQSAQSRNSASTTSQPGTAPTVPMPPAPPQSVPPVPAPSGSTPSGTPPAPPYTAPGNSQ